MEVMDAHVRLFRARHPGNPRAVMVAYRQYLLARKRQWGSARALIHHRPMIETYLWAKRCLTPNGAAKS